VIDEPSNDWVGCVGVLGLFVVLVILWFTVVEVCVSLWRVVFG